MACGVLDLRFHGHFGLAVGNRLYLKRSGLERSSASGAPAGLPAAE
jgi:hypothetical protein